MGFLDDAKDKARSLREQAEQVAKDHGDSIKQGLDRAEDAIDDKLSPERRRQARAAFGKAGDVVDDLAGDDADDQGERRERTQPERGGEHS